MKPIKYCSIFIARFLQRRTFRPALVFEEVMKSTRHTGILAIATLLLGGTINMATAQDLFVQVELNNLSENPNGCSILRVSPSGVLSEFVSNDDILAVSNATSCDVDDTGMAISPDGTLYFNEDVSDQIYQVTPAGVVSVFVDKATLDAAVGTSNDIDNGMTFGADGNLYAIDEDCDCIIQVTVPGGAVSVVVPEANILAATGKTGAQLNAGLARGDDGTFYFADESGDEMVLQATPAGVVSILATESDLTAVTGNSGTDLDVGIALDGNNLFVMEDRASSIVRIDVTTGTVTLVADESTLGPVTGNSGSFPIDLEGGIAIHPVNGNLFIGDDGFDETDNEDKANILEVTQSGTPSLFVSDSAITAFYETLYGIGEFDSRLRGSMVFLGAPVLSCEGFLFPMDQAVTVRRSPYGGNQPAALPFTMRLVDEAGVPVYGQDLSSPPVLDVMFDGEDASAVPEELPFIGYGDDGNRFEFVNSYWQFYLDTSGLGSLGTYYAAVVSGDESEYVVDPACMVTITITNPFSFFGW